MGTSSTGLDGASGDELLLELVASVDGNRGCLGLPELAEAASASRRAQQLTVLPMPPDRFVLSLLPRRLARHGAA